ncbi:uncharacterized protein YcbK (DUF882 family) [Rhodopseudomonas thermotolerans]|uniref:Murein endopeptidase K n=2 Tax=Rhodopseudomonas TaxID=1073 RepID=A0A336JQV8_9BRAD|nr:MULTISPECIES: DUF882 domain-containing protein [Rhodopseudomonas]RED30286.1 uncharacterized protein YcbK (DUF882 family) [Rhodopseudomonas pentothenatexigens]REF92500.1 uncharacterized protein YcbK (DUF882 family) [Rhodopseudomonas thermotolerans]SSW92155.1 uncharacterized protein YcbK [Rhodopseudomonas pentothenatexigens]
MPRAGYGAVLTSVLLLAGAGSVHDASAVGDSRTLSFHHTHSGESLTVTFKRSGRYDEDALKQLNHFLRDWRSQEKTEMDRRLFDILWEVYRDVDAKQPIQIISAYRSPATNAMLRRRSSGVARHSQHTLGHAMDFFIPGVALEQIRFAGLRLQRGGVGFYPTSGSPFVHLDTGGVRHWPRMTADQLARVFPDGRTVHVPSNGKPLRGYELALADIESRRDGSSAAPAKTNFLASLFGGKSRDDEDEAATAAKPSGAKPMADIKVAAADAVAAAAGLKPTEAPATDPVPMPRAKPAAAIQLASAGDVVLPAPRPAQAAKAEAKPADAKSAEPKLQTPADIINARGFWDDFPVASEQAKRPQVAAISAREALAAADKSDEAAMNALAYAAPVQDNSSQHPRSRHARVVTASAPIPHSFRSQNSRHAAVSGKIDSVIGKSSGQGKTVIATSARLAAAGSRDNDVWIRAMILMPRAMRTAATVIGDPDMTLLTGYFVKPEATLAMGFADDPQPGLYADAFSGTAVATLTTTSFPGDSSR